MFSSYTHTRDKYTRSKGWNPLMRNRRTRIYTGAPPLYPNSRRKVNNLALADDGGFFLLVATRNTF